MSVIWPEPATLLPHRPPQLLVTRILAVAPDHTAIDTLARVEAEQFPGHFPGRPILPGVAMIEILAQSLACLAAIAGESGLGMITGVDNARFRGVVALPGELEVNVRVTDRRFGLTLARGSARLAGKVVCSAEIRAVLVPADGPGAP